MIIYHLHMNEPPQNVISCETFTLFLYIFIYYIHTQYTLYKYRFRLLFAGRKKALPSAIVLSTAREQLTNAGYKVSTGYDKIQLPFWCSGRQSTTLIYCKEFELGHKLLHNIVWSRLEYIYEMHFDCAACAIDK